MQTITSPLLLTVFLIAASCSGDPLPLVSDRGSDTDSESDSVSDTDTDLFDWVTIPGGTYLIGCDGDGWYLGEPPEPEVAARSRPGENGRVKLTLPFLSACRPAKPWTSRRLPVAPAFALLLLLAAAVACKCSSSSVLRLSAGVPAASHCSNSATNIGALNAHHT